MNVIIKINCDNAAFADCPSAEVSRILTELAEKVAGADFHEPFDSSIPLQDYNGNRVGELRVK